MYSHIDVTAYDCSQIIDKQVYDASNPEKCSQINSWYPKIIPKEDNVNTSMGL